MVALAIYSNKAACPCAWALAMRSSYYFFDYLLKKKYFSALEKVVRVYKIG
jgi:hypothetical protein